MSLMPKETVTVIAQTVGISNLSNEVSSALAPDVEYRMREIMQDAIKCMHHCKRSTLTTEDVSSALSLRNVEPLYGFASNDPLRFKRALGHSDLFYVEDREVDCKEIIEAPIPPAPVDVSVTAHWLAIEGVQPAIPENVPIQPLAPPPSEKRAVPGTSSGEELVEVRPAVRHVLSKELQLYFEKVSELIIVGRGAAHEALLQQTLHSLATDAGLHPLLPYFAQFIQDEVTRSLEDIPLLFSLMRVVHSLLHNPHIHVDPYLPQLNPSVMTCLLAKGLGGKEGGYRHWELRDFTAKLVAIICGRFGHTYQDLQPRLTKTMVVTFLNPKRAVTQHYGAVKGLTALGPAVVRLLLFPNIRAYLQLLEPELDPEQANELKRYEAWRVYDALQQAVGSCMYTRIKEQLQNLGPGFSSPIRLKKALAVVTNPQSAGEIIGVKRKRMSEDDTAHKSDQLRLFFNVDDKIDELTGLMAVDQCQSTAKGEERSTAGKSDATSARSIQDSSQKIHSDPLATAWQNEALDGKVWESLLELFGDGVLPFVPTDQLKIVL